MDDWRLVIVASSIVCPICQTVYQASQTLCPTCSLPNMSANPTESLKITNNTGFILNVGESSFDYKHALRLHLPSYGKKMDINFEKYLLLGRESYEGEAYLDFSEFNGLELGISRRHARLIRHPFSLICQDLSSTNGTFINGEQVDPNKPMLLRDGDELRLGMFKMRVEFVLAHNGK